MHRFQERMSWWESLSTPRPLVFSLLILAGILLEFVVHFRFGIAVVYTHFSYLIVVVAGLWYGRRAVPVAFFFGALHAADMYLGTGLITPDAIIRAGMLVIVALIAGMAKEQSDSYRDQLLARNRELEKTNVRLVSSQSAFESANKKLNLLSGITRHDINNQILALMGFIGLAGTKTTDPGLLHDIERAQTAVLTIQRQIEFTRNYEDIGVRAPQWQDVGLMLAGMQAMIPEGEITISVTVEGLEVFADPLLEKVFENLIDNSRRHGERVGQISVSAMPSGPKSVAIVFGDNGIGIPEADKERIFKKGFGKNTGLGLFLSREILSITGLSIQETGVYGQGARFEILVPEGKFRFTSKK
jgi:signal transduction histidine kinase